MRAGGGVENLLSVGVSRTAEFRGQTGPRVEGFLGVPPSVADSSFL